MNSQSGTYKYEATCRCMYQIGKLQPLQVLPCDTCQFRCEEPLVPVGLVQEVSPVPSSLSRMAARSGNTCNLLRIQDAVNSFSTGVPRSTLITEALKDVLTILLTPNKAIIPSLRNCAVKLAVQEQNSIAKGCPPSRGSSGLGLRQNWTICAHKWYPLAQASPGWALSQPLMLKAKQRRDQLASRMHNLSRQVEACHVTARSLDPWPSSKACSVFSGYLCCLLPKSATPS